VIDSSDPKIDEKMKVVTDILDAIHATKNIMYVFNKIDSISKKQLSLLKKSYKHLSPVFISSHTEEGLQKLKEAILLK
jgi:50S ribosomal subunit-associated GTPase HflX